ncbi:MAG: class I SAM-dependent methyltransferase [Elusimicrobia bacterium]|nr:class I SAM-dependent methyltransferase [Elusimicrobiota bacterium]
MSLETALYDEPAWYDLLHAGGTKDEAALVLDLFRLHGNGGKDILEPACGTGRLLAFFRKKGFRVTGYDINPKALSFARKKNRRARLIRKGMTDFCEPSSFDLAFNLLGTFRHLLHDQDALRHLTLTARSLRKGGIYIVQLDLADYEHPEDDEETWTVRAGARRIEHVMMSLAPERRTRRERIIHFLTLKGEKKECLLHSRYDLRSYDLAQWEWLVWRSPLRLVAALIHPRQGPGVRDGVFVLRRARD